MDIYKYFYNNNELATISQKIGFNFSKLSEIFPKILNSDRDHYTLSILMAAFIYMKNNNLSFYENELIEQSIKDIMPRARYFYNEKEVVEGLFKIAVSAGQTHLN